MERQKDTELDWEVWVLPPGCLKQPPLVYQLGAWSSFTGITMSNIALFALAFQK